MKSLIIIVDIYLSSTSTVTITILCHHLRYRLVWVINWSRWRCRTFPSCGAAGLACLPGQSAPWCRPDPSERCPSQTLPETTEWSLHTWGRGGDSTRVLRVCVYSRRSEPGTQRWGRRGRSRRVCRTSSPDSPGPTLQGDESVTDNKDQSVGGRLWVDAQTHSAGDSWSLARIWRWVARNWRGSGSSTTRSRKPSHRQRSGTCPDPREEKREGITQTSRLLQSETN